MTTMPLSVSKRFVPGVVGAIKQLLAMEQQLDSAKTYDAIRRIVKQAEALKTLLGEIDEVRQKAEWVILLGKQRIGIELKNVPAAPRGRARFPTDGKSGKAATGIPHNTRSRLGQLARFSKPELRSRAAEMWRDGREATVSSILHEHSQLTRSERRKERERALAEKILALPDKTYGVIYADPPWKFEPYADSGEDRNACNHYPVMATEQIATVAIPAADDAVLFLWSTTPMLPQCSAVMAAWGFEYKSYLVWIKDRTGTGYWTLNRAELLLIGTRGNIPAPTPGEQPPQVIEAPRGRHSEKPAVFAEIIERLYPNVPKLEMFARSARPGWDAWGDEVPSITEAAE
jgi:N6-adenosine-specific RNA methylase IME4